MNNENTIFDIIGDALNSRSDRNDFSGFSFHKERAKLFGEAMKILTLNLRKRLTHYSDNGEIMNVGSKKFKIIEVKNESRNINIH